MSLRHHTRHLISMFACIIIAGPAGAQDILTLDGKWMVTTMGTASKPTEAPDALAAGRYTIEIHGTSLVSTTQ